MVKQGKSKLKQAQVTASSAVDSAHPTIAQRQCTQKDDPKVGQASGNHQARQALRVGNVTFIKAKSARLLVRKGLRYQEQAVSTAVMFVTK